MVFKGLLIESEVKTGKFSILFILFVKVITPTLSVSKLTSPVQRFPPSMRVRPQPLMMAPVCLTPGGNTNQVKREV